MTTDNHSDSQVQPDLDAGSSTFRSDNAPQFGQQPQFQYAGSNTPFAIDTDMANIDSFTANVNDSPSTNTPLNVTSVDSDSAAHGHAGPSSVASNIDPAMGNVRIPSTPGMAPPQHGQGQRGSIGLNQGQQAAYSPTAPRASIDDTPDGSLGGSIGDLKRKRSKVSRACDECRRKKVRCDAAADDGTIKTCTNCAKAGVLCGYNRIPMKRGPSKGYIKELSERVQQVESQMALSNTPSNFRQSMDGSTGGMYADQSLYSPEDNMSFKRNFSFSDQQTQRSPFSNSEYNRDRMPSLGWNAVSPHTSGFRGSISNADRPRDRGSVAIAPDQQLPTPSTTSASKPFWMNDNDGPRAAKRLKLSIPMSELVDAPDMGQEFLAKYYTGIHRNLPILPDADVAVEIVRKATPKFQHAMVAAVNFLPDADTNTQNGKANGESTAPVTITAFNTRKQLYEFIWLIAKDDPVLRSREDNLVLMWIDLLMAVEAERDLVRLRGGDLSKAMIIKLSVDLGWACINIEESKSRELSVPDSDAEVGKQYKIHLARAWYCAGILARLHALSVGTTNPMPYEHEVPLPKPPAVFPANQAYLALSVISLNTVFNLTHSVFSGAPFNRQFEVDRRGYFLAHLEDIFSFADLSADNKEAQAQTIRLFFNLLTARATMVRSPVEIASPAIMLASALKEFYTGSQHKHVYDPLHIHYFTLTTITLLEFTQEGVDEEMGTAAKQAIADLKETLEQICERDDMETKQPEADDKEDTVEQIHWAKALVDMIDARAEAAAAASTNRRNGNDGEHAAREVTNEYTVAADFSLLLKHGYINVLAESVDC